MTAAIIIRCDGTPAIRRTIPLGQCRAAYPARDPREPEARAEAQAKGWSRYGLLDLCPSCTGYRT